MNQLQFNIAQIKIDLMIRQSLYFGQTIEQNFEPVITQQIMGSFVKDSLEIILASLDRKTFKMDIDQQLLEVFHGICTNELNSLYSALQLLTGLSLEEFARQSETRIKEAVFNVSGALRMLAANPKSIVLVK